MSAIVKDRFMIKYFCKKKKKNLFVKKNIFVKKKKNFMSLKNTVFNEFVWFKMEVLIV